MTQFQLKPKCMRNFVQSYDENYHELVLHPPHLSSHPLPHLPLCIYHILFVVDTLMEPVETESILVWNNIRAELIHIISLGKCYSLR